MRVLDTARSNLIPLLARVLLFLAFVPIGWHHAMEQGLFTGPQAERLRELGVASAGADSPSIVRAARPLAQESGIDSGPEPGAAIDGSIEPPLVADGWAPGGVEARALHELTLTLDRLGLPGPHVGAWVLTVFELVGGALLLVGLFSRLWAGGLFVWLVAIFALVSWPSVRGTWFFTTPEPALSVAISQLALAVLALLVVTAGAGRWSLDGQIFRRAESAGDEDDE